MSLAITSTLYSHKLYLNRQNQLVVFPQNVSCHPVVAFNAENFMKREHQTKIIMLAHHSRDTLPKILLCNLVTPD
jgi:hypothetical protein